MTLCIRIEWLLCNVRLKWWIRTPDLQQFGMKVKYVTTRPSHQYPQIDVSFPEKLLNIAATRGEIFSLKFTKYRLAAELRPDPLGELKLSPRPPSRNKGISPPQSFLKVGAYVTNYKTIVLFLLSKSLTLVQLCEETRGTHI